MAREKALADGRGPVTLPEALERKYPRASWEPGWQWVFPASREYVDKQTGLLRKHHLHPTAAQRAFRTAAKKAGLTKHATATACDIHLPPTCLRLVMTSGQFRSFSVIATSTRP
jgi:hypothetical protein